MAAPGATDSRWRRVLLGGLIATTLATLVVVGLEWALRVAGVGHDPTFYRRVAAAAGGTEVRENRWVTAPYFPGELIRRPQPFRLPAEKALGAYRIVVLGSSAAMGDPEPSFSLARVLDVLLRDAYPELEFEVVNAGITAINSHVVRHLARDSAKLNPDLFIVYEGHNEVIGPYGPATVFTAFRASPTALRVSDTLRRTRLGQWVGARAAARRGEAGWGGMAMFLGRQVTAADPRLEAVRAHFRRNLLAVAEAGHAVGATTLVCTVLTNQRDFAPFLSMHRAGLRAPERAEWEAAVAVGDAELAAGRVRVAEARYRQALALDDQHAELVFKLARLALGQGRTEEARELFQRALDLDTLRFRADSGLNATIRELAAPGLTVIDVAAAAAATSAGGILGDEYLLEHVHFSLAGTYVVAKELFIAVGDELVRRGRTPRAVRQPLPLEEVRLRLAYTAYEQALIMRELLERYERPPFTAQADRAQRVQALVQKQQAAQRLLSRPETVPGLTALYEQALRQRPDDWVIGRNYGMALVSLGVGAAALPPLERAARIMPDDTDLLHALALARQQQGQDAAAGEAWQRLRELEPRFPGLPPPPPPRP